jgi:hypothetical protein
LKLEINFFGRCLNYGVAPKALEWNLTTSFSSPKEKEKQITNKKAIVEIQTFLAV